MIQPHTVQRCRWAGPTLFQPRPFWFEAADYEWSCTIDGTPRVVRDPAACRTCARWAPDEAELSPDSPTS